MTQEIGLVRLRKVLVLHLFDVGAGREGLLAACHDDGADAGIFISGISGMVQFVEKL